jgi:tetratricopeptide (TPR) repeat protein
LNKTNSNSNLNTIKGDVSFSNRSPVKESPQAQVQAQQDLRKLFEHIQVIKVEIDSNIKSKNYLDAILLINKCLPLAKKFYQEDHLFNIEILFKLAECYIQISNLEEAINSLENLLNLTEKSKKTNSISVFRFNSNMLIGATCINVGDYNKAIKSYTIAEEEIIEVFTSPELNLKLSSIYLNIGISYIYLGNLNIAEKYLKKGISQSDGMLGNEIIYKVLIFMLF